jgi:hypothetical protein
MLTGYLTALTNSISIRNARNLLRLRLRAGVRVDFIPLNEFEVTQ